MSDYAIEGAQADITEMPHRYNGGVGVGQQTTRVEWDHRVVIVCHSAHKKRSLAVKYGKDKQRIRCPRCHKWAAMQVIELAPDDDQ